MENETVEMPEADWDLSKISDNVWRYNTAELLKQVDEAGTTDSIAVEVNCSKTSLIVLHSIGAKTGPYPPHAADSHRALRHLCRGGVQGWRT